MDKLPKDPLISRIAEEEKENSISSKIDLISDDNELLKTAEK